MPESCRIFPLEHASGPWLMAADEWLLEAAIERQAAALRFYTWTEPTASLGYFQPVADFLHSESIRSLSVVRRSTGGETLVHHHELTYAFALPAGLPWHPQGRSWIATMHELIQRALTDWGIKTRLCDQEHRRAEIFCFQHHTPCDVLLEEHKVVGSAQRKRRGALLQHGGILLERSRFTSELPGIFDIVGKAFTQEKLVESIQREWRMLLDCELIVQPWERSEIAQIDEKVTTRYANPEWTLKR